MASTIKLKNGSGAPLAGDLVQGEPALDLTNKRLYTEDSGGNVIEVGINPTTVTTGNITSSGTVSVDTIAEKTAANGVVVDGVTLKDGGITVTADVVFGDSDKAIFGAGSDLQIYHDPATGSYISELGAGSLFIQTNNNGVVIEKSDGTDLAYFDAVNSRVALYNGGATKLLTTSTGINVTGTVEADTAHFGTGTGTGIATADEVVVSGTGSTGITIHSPDANNATLAFGSATDNDYAFVQGYYNSGSPFLRFSIQNSEKAKVTSTGIDVTGTVTADGLTLGNAQYVKLSDATTDSPRVLGMNASNTTYIGPIDSYDGGGIIYGASASVNAQSFLTGGNNRLVIGSGGDISFYEDTGTTAKLFWDASAEKLGIGTTSPSQALQVASGSVELDLGFNLQWGGGLSNSNPVIWADLVGSSLRFSGGSGSESMRIDSSGNLLVGTTDTSLYNNGAGGNTGNLFVSNGQYQNATSNTVNAVFNRLDSDGEIIRLSKNGATVGSIGTLGGELFIASDDVGLQFDASGNNILPYGGGFQDGVIDLGGSAQRFKDLYLSGGVYLGGTAGPTGDPNNYLDDYEEGTFTPTAEGTTTAGTATYAGQNGHYTKIGNRVFFRLSIGWTAHTGTGNIRIAGLPFTAAAIGFNDPALTGTTGLTFSGQLISYIVQNTSSIKLFSFATGATETPVPMDTACSLYISGNYRV